MPEPTSIPSGPARRPKRFLTAEQKYELWVKTLTGELSTVQAAAQAGVDRSTIMTLRRSAKDGAIAALQASVPGRRRNPAEESELARLRAENARLQDTIVELSIENVALRGKVSWGS
jgi:transposase-like protein